MATTDTPSIEAIFQKKYIEFCDDLIGAYPEMLEQITVAKNLTEDDKINRFRNEVLTVNLPNRNPDINPNMVLPDVKIENNIWLSFSNNTRKAINEYITLLSFCCMFNDNKTPWSEQEQGQKGTNKWMDEMMNQWKDKLNTIDFKSLSEKIMKMMGGTGDGTGTGTGTFNIPKRLLKGQLAKLAEELIKEFKPEDFGLTPEQIADSETNPSRSFELLMQIYTQKPELLQNAMKRIAKKLQDKVRKGELKPKDLAAEAEEMMKEFTDNPAFVELMETFRTTFGFEDKETAQAAGRDGENRLSIARARLRTKLENKNKNKNK